MNFRLFKKSLMLLKLFDYLRKKSWKKPSIIIIDHDVNIYELH